MATRRSSDSEKETTEMTSVNEPQDTATPEASAPETAKPRPSRRRPTRRVAQPQTTDAVSEAAAPVVVAAPSVVEAPAAPSEPPAVSSEAADASTEAQRPPRRRPVRRRPERPRRSEAAAEAQPSTESAPQTADMSEPVVESDQAANLAGEDTEQRSSRPSRNSRRRAKRKAARPLVEGEVSAEQEASSDEASTEPAEAQAEGRTLRVNLQPRGRNNNRRRREPAITRDAAALGDVQDQLITDLPVEPIVTDAPVMIPGLDDMQPEPQNRSRRDRSRQRRVRPRPEAAAAPEAPEAAAPVAPVAAVTPASTDAPVAAATQRPNRTRTRKPARPQPAPAQPAAAQPIVVQPVAPKPVAQVADVAKPAATPRPAPVRRVRRPEPKIKVAVAKLTLPKREAIKLGMRRGHPEIVISGAAVAPMFFFGFISGGASERRVLDQVRMAASAGVHLHMLLIELVVDLNAVDAVVEEARRQIRLVTEHDPEGYVMLRLMFTPPQDWKSRYRDAVSHYADNSTGEPSFFSDEYWAEAEAVVTDLSQKMEMFNEAERLLGYHLDCREWFHEYERGYDTCKAATECFRRWLRSKYKDDLVLLRAAWHNGTVSLEDASIPPKPKDGNVVLFENHRERPWVDFLQFASDTVAKRLVSISRASKKACDSRRLIAVPYGYTLDFPTAYSGHLDLAEVLSTSSIDMVCAPPSYRDRLVGSGSSIPAPIDSVLLHEKLFIMEDDTKPYFAKRDTPDTYNPKHPDRESTTGARLRAMGSALARQTGISWMDLWGEGWLADDEHWKHAAKALAIYRKLIECRNMNSAPDVAFIVDECSITHMRNTEKLLLPLLLQQRDVVLKSGVNFGMYLQSDLTRKAFPEAKVYVFMNALQINTEVRAAIQEKLQNGDKTLVWVYAAGVYDENGENKDGIREVTGLQIRPQPWNSESGSIIVSDRHPIAEHLKAKQFGVRERLNPSYYSNEQGATVIAEYVQTGLPSVVCKDMGSWKSIFIGERQLNLDLLRNIFKQANVSVFQHGTDVLRVSQPFICLHATDDGSKSIVLPIKMMVYDLIEGRVLAASTNNLKIGMKKGQSVILVAGSPSELKALGLDVPEDPDVVPSAATIAHDAEDLESAAAKRRRRGGRKHRKPHTPSGT